MIGGSWGLLEGPGGSWGLLKAPEGSWRLLKAPGGSWLFCVRLSSEVAPAWRRQRTSVPLLTVVPGEHTAGVGVGVGLDEGLRLSEPCTNTLLLTFRLILGCLGSSRSFPTANQLFLFLELKQISD